MPIRPPVWTTDGKRIVFTSEQGGVRNLFWQADHGGAVERLVDSPNRQAATGVAPDGRVIHRVCGGDPRRRDGRGFWTVPRA